LILNKLQQQFNQTPKTIFIAEILVGLFGSKTLFRTNSWKPSNRRWREKWEKKEKKKK